MSELVLGHTGNLARASLVAAHDLLAHVFAGELTDHDWEHCLGGLHALVWDGPELIGHAALVQRRILHRGRAWRAGYVEGVGVRSDARRRGHAARMMSALEAVAADAYELAALGATDEAAAFYAARGWRRWQGTTSALTPGGIMRTTEEDDCIYVLPFSADLDLDLDGELTCDWRDGDVW